MEFAAVEGRMFTWLGDMNIIPVNDMITKLTAEFKGIKTYALKVGLIEMQYRQYC